MRTAERDAAPLAVAPNGGAELVVDALGDHAGRRRLRVGQLVDDFDRLHRLLAVPAGPDGSRLATLLTRSEDRVRLAEGDYTAYRRVTDQHLAVFRRNDPLARFIFHGGPGCSR